MKKAGHCIYESVQTRGQFWTVEGADINDPSGDYFRAMGIKCAICNLKCIDQINTELFSDFIRQAVKLNLEKGDPTKNK